LDSNSDIGTQQYLVDSNGQVLQNKS